MMILFSCAYFVPIWRNDGAICRADNQLVMLSNGPKYIVKNLFHGRRR